MSRRVAVILFASVICSCMAIFAAGMTMRGMLGGGPYRMTLRPEVGHTVVRFLRPDRKFASPEFRVDLIITKPRSVDLDSGASPLKGMQVEFFDTTLLPGRFKLRIGRTLFDVMERAIIVEGKEYDWRPN